MSAAGVTRSEGRKNPPRICTIESGAPLMTDDTTLPRKRGRPQLTLSDAERAERIRVYQRDYGLKRRAKDPEAARAYAREYRAKRMSENPEAVLEAEREAARRSRAKRRRAALTGASVQG
jgi:hypothetical protein